MKSDLIWGIVFILLALLMVFCIVVNCVNQNWAGLPICGFAFGLNLMSGINRFRDYKRHKKYENIYSIMSIQYWGDQDEDESESTAGVLSSGGFMDD